MTTGTRRGSGPTPTTAGPLRVVLSVELPEDLPCVVANADGEVTDVSQHLKRDDCGCRSDGWECHSELTLDDGADVRREYVQSDVRSGCVCRSFQRTDCIPEIRAVDGRTMTVSLILPDRSVLREVVERVRATGATVRLERLVDEADDGQTIEIDARAITSKQREALELAVEEGYYDEPRETDLGELADMLGVSKSAVSQRLNAAESKLVRSLTGDGT